MDEQIEAWRVAASEWLDLQEAADLLRESKNDVFAQITSKMNGTSEAERQRLARISPEWTEYREKLVKAEGEARRHKLRVKYADMKFWAAQSANANARKELGKYGA